MPDEIERAERRTDDDPCDQSRRFIEAARELGCDVDQETFERAVWQIAKPKPKHRTARRLLKRRNKRSRIGLAVENNEANPCACDSYT